MAKPSTRSKNDLQSIKSALFFMESRREARRLMEQEKDDGNLEPKSSEKKPGRGWTSRLQGYLIYRRFVDLDGGGDKYIFFIIEKPSRSSEHAREIYEVFDQMKYLSRPDGSKYRSGLRFNLDSRLGPVWKIPDTPTGRFTADQIDAALGELGERLDSKPDRTR